jgi:hypothetical protein
MFEQCKLKNMTVADLIFQFCMPVYMQPLLPLVYDAKLVLQLDAIILHLHQPRSYHAAVTPYQEKVLPRHQRIMSMWALQRLRVCGFTRYSSEHASMQALQQHFGWVVGTHPMKFTHALTCSKDSSLVDKSVPVAPVAKDSAINLWGMAWSHIAAVQAAPAAATAGTLNRKHASSAEMWLQNHCSVQRHWLISLGLAHEFSLLVVMTLLLDST